MLIVMGLLSIFAAPSDFGKAQRTSFRLHSGRNDVEFDHKGRRRTAVIFVPRDTTKPSDGWPLVMMLHGAGGSSKNVIESTGWAELGEKDGFITLFPDGTPKYEKRPASFLGNPQTWNAGEKASLSSGELSATAKNVDDVGFLGELIDRVRREIKVDPKRIYVAGHSNGSGMSYRFSSERADLVAAVGVVAGHFSAVPNVLVSPVSLIQIIGDQDPFTPMAGGEAGVLGVKAVVPPALESPATWAKLLGLLDSPKVVRDDKDLKILVWSRLENRAEVRTIIIKGHGHAYPSPHDTFHPRILFGPTVSTLDATETMWKFFREHAKE